MSKRRPSSPYPHPPSAFVRDLTRAGWRRCDAEALALVAGCLEHAVEASFAGGLDVLAKLAADALKPAPVLAGAALLLAPRRELSVAFTLLLRAAPVGRKVALYRLWDVATMHRIAREDEDDDWPVRSRR